MLYAYASLVAYLNEVHFLPSFYHSSKVFCTYIVDHGLLLSLIETFILRYLINKYACILFFKFKCF